MRGIFSPTVMLTMALMAVIVMMILPMPSWVLDIGLAASFAFAILIFTVTLFVERPLDFSSFPTVLLASLMLRLSLNISSTKLIIGEGHTGTGAAGEVIEGFASFVMGGSLFLGLVVFGVLLIVNFVVITKGAARMAEVGARFALDGMPGKQLAIDSDMSAGAIDHEEAKRRREVEQAETTFLGSLDGASKFVKGDAIAGLLITLLNLTMGVLIGAVIHGMDLGRAFETYAILTVGDGLVSQIPAVIISIATALLLSRGGARGSADFAMLAQLGKFPAAIGTVAVLMAAFALFPGLPFVPFLIGATVLGALAFRLRGKVSELEVHETEDVVLPIEETMGDVLDLDEIHVEFSQDLVPMILDTVTGLDARIKSMRQHVAISYGVILPDIRLTDDASLRAGEYVIRVQGVTQAKDSLDPARVLALLPQDETDVPLGRDVKEPVYGAPARWLAQADSDAATLAGATVVSPAEVMATHLLEVIKDNLSRIVNLKSLRRLLDELCSLTDVHRRDANKRLFDDLIPDKVPMDLLLSVIRLLLEERVSIRNLTLIAESIAESRGAAATPETICEHVRQRLAFQIVGDLRDPDGTVPLIQLATDWETRFTEYQLGEGLNGDVALPPDLFQKLTSGVAEKLGKASEAGHFPAVITSLRRRRFLRALLSAKGITNPVLSFEELGTEARPALVGLVPA